MFTADQLEELKSQLEIHFYLIANSFIVHKKDAVNEPTNYTFWENELREIYSRFSNSNDGETPLMKQKVIQSIPNLVLKLKGKHEIYKNNLRIKNSLFLQFNKKSAKLNCESDSFSESELNPSKISNTNIKGQKVLKKRENRPGTYKKWISSEDELLYLGLLCYGFTDFNFDNKMVSTFCLPGRNRKQIYDRIRYKTNRRSKPNRIKDLFLRPFKPMVELELYIMREGIRVYKGNFLIIAERLFPQIPRYLLKHTWEAMYLRREVSLNFILSAGLNIADYERPNSHDKMELLSSTTSCEGIEVKNAIPNVKSSSRKSKSKPIIKPNVPSLYLEKNSCKKLQNEKLKRQPFLPHKIPNTSLVNIGRGKMYVGKEYNHQLLNSSDVKSVSALKKSPQLMPTLLNFTPNTSALVANESSSDIDELNSARWYHRRNSTAGKNESLKMEYGLDVFSSPILNLQHKQSFRKSSVENKENIPFMAQLCQDSKKNIKQREKSVQRNLCDVFTGKDFGNNNVCAPHSNNSKEESQFLEKQKNIFMHQQHSLFSDYGDLNCNSLQLYNNSLVSPSNNNFYTKYSNQSNSINLNLANNMKRKNNQEKIQLAAINNSSLNKPVHIEKSKGNVIVRPFDSFKDNLNNPLMTRNTHGIVEPKTPGGNANLSEDTENLSMGKKRIKKDNTRREKSSKKIKVFGESNI
ncbi:hypothetical protein HDU92_003889 [Lobulomyces angularis]|nr:hypothetical protein HDU92_003889 [Lobulomyces angularis]